MFLEPLSDEQRTERLEKEVKRVEEQEATTVLSASLREKIRLTPAIRSTYADAERLAFLELEKEIGKPFRKYVRVSSHGRTEVFDGVLITKDEAHLIEVKYFSRPMFKREFLEALIHRASTFMWDKTVDDKVNRERVIFWIAIVVDFSEEALPDFKRQVEEAVRCDLFTINLRIYSLSDLKAKYG